MASLLAKPDCLWHEQTLAHLLAAWLADALASCFRLRRWRSPRKVTRSADDHGRGICERAREFMSANCDRQIRLADIALHSGASVRSLTRFFRLYTGRSVNDALMRLRLERAHAMLTNGSAQSVKEAAYAAGFLSPAYFTECFRKVYGVVPSAIRTASPRD